ncbi:hypothetical protein BHV55_06750 [Bacillus sp. RZ2MS9]|uniref:hypothetical protein n=1 Tax=Bacillus sp. RZ2MS9 TaxID=1806216 RepID=UPI00111306FF|nr:hypothetical protein [Bacillus sp. RZ2MS9]QIZ41386.1 hypothetical protein BHV55_06750 [Bacillus sp. RZ2MS9]
MGQTINKQAVESVLRPIESKLLEDATSEQLEDYLMRKMTHHFMRWEMGTEEDCFIWINHHRKRLGLEVWQDDKLMLKLLKQDFFDICVRDFTLDKWFELKRQYGGNES